MKSSFYIALIFLICSVTVTYGQVLERDTIPGLDDTVLDTIPSRSDSVGIARDSISTFAERDTSSSGMQEAQFDSGNQRNVKISNDQPDKPIDYGSTDSSYLDLKQNQIHLFGEAFVRYGKYNLDAGYIIFDFDDNEASAFDTLPGGLKLTSPTFSDGTNNFTSSGLRYNFKSNKGLIYDAITQEGEFQVLGSKTKFVSADADSMSTADQIYNSNAVITTCTNARPHYGIRSRKLKVVPNRLAVAGFSQLELAGIPTPVILPFGFYPLVDGLSSGIIFPADFDSSPELGLGMRGVGYYFPISDYLDATVTADLYTRGTHRINISSNFKKRYRYSGNVTIRYADNRIEDPTDLNLPTVSNKGFAFRLTRNQDSKAHPYQSISGTIDISTGNLYSVNFNDFERATQQQYGSSFNYKNSLPGTPLSLVVGLSHNQNTASGDMNITLPDAKLTMTTVYPFKSKIPSSTEKWYEKINVSGSSAFKAFVNTKDSLLFTKQTLDDIQTGMYNRATMSGSFKALKFLNISPSITADQYVYAKQKQLTFDSLLLFENIDSIFDQDSIFQGIEQDTIFGTLEEDIVNDFTSLHKFNMGVSLNTQIFGTKKWSKGWLRGIRHTMKPSVSYNFSPSTLNRQDTMRATLDPSIEDQFEVYNPFQSGIFNTGLSGPNSSMSFSIVNNFEGKYYSKKDSTEKKFQIFRDIRISTNYNLAADSLNWSPLMLTGNTQLTKFTRLNLSARYNFYVSKNGNLTSETVWNAKKRPFEFARFDATFTTGMSVKDIFNVFRKKKSKASSSGSRRPGTSNSREGGTTFLETFENFKINHIFKLDLERMDDGSDTLKIATHQLRINGSLQLTPKWSVNVQNIQYDFNKGEFVYPAFTLSRDLHCWEMNVSWYPESNIYGFAIKVKSSALSFLKYNYGQQNTDILGFGR